MLRESSIRLETIGETAFTAGPSDGSLLRRFRGGDSDAGSTLYRRYSKRLLALVRSKRHADLAARLDHEDIVQSVFGSFFQGAERGYYNVSEGEELWNLLLVMTLNKVRAEGVYHRAAKRDVRRTVGDEGFKYRADGPDDDDHALMELAVREALEQLPPVHRRVVELRLEGNGVAEVAVKLKRPKRSVERILQECRHELADLLGD